MINGSNFLSKKQKTMLRSENLSKCAIHIKSNHQKYTENQQCACFLRFLFLSPNRKIHLVMVFEGKQQVKTLDFSYFSSLLGNFSRLKLKQCLLGGLKNASHQISGHLVDNFLKAEMFVFMIFSLVCDNDLTFNGGALLLVKYGCI